MPTFLNFSILILYNSLYARKGRGWGGGYFKFLVRTDFAMYYGRINMYKYIIKWYLTGVFLLTVLAIVYN